MENTEEKTMNEVVEETQTIDEPTSPINEKIEEYAPISIEESKQLGLFKVSLLNRNGDSLDPELEEGVTMYSVDVEKSEICVVVQTECDSRLYKDADGKFKVEDWKYPHVDELENILKSVFNIRVTYLNRYGKPYDSHVFGSIKLQKIINFVSYSRCKEKCFIFSFKNVRKMH